MLMVFGKGFGAWGLGFRGYVAISPKHQTQEVWRLAFAAKLKEALQKTFGV